ncbi:hypothetical protein L228DRAFT_182145 [Xylona heveae TC161]|uniref:Uncharacterized protein n=1 Tax=Xylona heveae (strain CBS 132557 / TC161) TaxID=1328760 RepID=A0A165FFT3_XYLHT|nr:hypothetical protein L228DRAFT_182145 [Xylona heveae TC161]KZF20925.1 hypothetical protein L228DRAFT_182145 [Xylona heveae TC161]
MAFVLAGIYLSLPLYPLTCLFSRPYLFFSSSPRYPSSHPPFSCSSRLLLYISTPDMSNQQTCSLLAPGICFRVASLRLSRNDITSTLFALARGGLVLWSRWSRCFLLPFPPPFSPLSFSSLPLSYPLAPWYGLRYGFRYGDFSLDFFFRSYHL